MTGGTWRTASWGRARGAAGVAAHSCAGLWSVSSARLHGGALSVGLRGPLRLRDDVFARAGM